MVRYSKVIINSVTIKDDKAVDDPKKVVKWEYSKADSDPNLGCEISCLKTINDLLSVSNGQIVEIYRSEDNITYTRAFYGTIDKVAPNGALIDLACRNEINELVKGNVNKVYDSSIDPSAGVISEIAEDLIETQGGLTASVQDSGTEQIINEFKCIHTDIYERVKALKDALNWTIYYDDENRLVHFEPRGYDDSGITLQTSDNIISVPEWDFDTNYMINDLRVDGATIDTTITESGQIDVTSGYTTTSILLAKTPNSVEVLFDASSPPTTQLVGGSKDASTGNDYYIDVENKKIIPTATFTTNYYAKTNYIWSAPAPIHMINQASIDLYGKYQKAVELSDITSVADAESRAATILQKQSIPFISGVFKIKSTINLKVGQMVNVIDNITPSNVSGNYMVQKVTYSYPSGSTEIEVGDETYRTADWQENTETRLKRLEEQFIQNQDILTELVNIENTESTNFRKPTPRYFKASTTDLAGMDYMIWNSESFGTWNDMVHLWYDATDPNLPTEEETFVMQYQNIYTEDFIDADFKSTNTTAAWTTTGSVNFISGQIAESSAFALNNGTITSAYFSATEVSGSFDYELTADGTNWESVTNNSPHSFTNTGNDLRWRATESGASTGEISKIEVTDY